jgi:hypothetical protein
MKAYGGVDVQIHARLSTVLVGGEWSAWRPGLFIPVENTNWMGGWVGPRACLDIMESRKSCPYRDSNSDPSAVYLVASRKNSNYKFDLM